MTDIVKNALVVQDGEGASLTEIQARIYLIRGVQVMLDRDLAALYQVETKALNQAVKRNNRRFPERFMFQLTKEEFENWKSQIVTSNRGRSKWGLRLVREPLLLWGAEGSAACLVPRLCLKRGSSA